MTILAGRRDDFFYQLANRLHNDSRRAADLVTSASIVSATLRHIYMSSEPVGIFIVLFGFIFLTGGTEARKTVVWCRYNRLVL